MARRCCSPGESSACGGGARGAIRLRDRAGGGVIPGATGRPVPRRIQPADAVQHAAQPDGLPAGGGGCD